MLPRPRLQALMYAAETERLPGIILICRAGEDEGTCLRHGYHIRQTVDYWRIGMTLWQCGADDVRLADCRKIELMQENTP